MRLLYGSWLGWENTRVRIRRATYPRFALPFAPRHGHGAGDLSIKSRRHGIPHAKLAVLALLQHHRHNDARRLPRRVIDAVRLRPKVGRLGPEDVRHPRLRVA